MIEADKISIDRCLQKSKVETEIDFYKDEDGGGIWGKKNFKFEKLWREGV